MAQKQLPVYLFTGFLSGGKTHMIQESMEDERFNSGEKTLILLCCYKLTQRCRAAARWHGRA